MVRIQRALLSVWDKTGVVEFAAALAAHGVEILSTGGTARVLHGASIPVISVETVTGFPEILDGRVKSLHPAIHAAILARDDERHRAELATLGISPIDLVAVSLYPFESPALAGDLPMSEALDLIDIGGVALLRAAAKNWPRVAVVCDPAQYTAVIDELRQGEGTLSDETRRRLAQEAFARTAAYDASITTYLSQHAGAFPEVLTLGYRKVQDTRYGENPHQRGAFYRQLVPRPGTLPQARQLQGKELSFNNLADLDVAWGLVWEFTHPAAAIIKHASPCGVALASTLAQAYTSARACDPTSAFGGIVALNRPVDETTAEELLTIFTEAVIAPSYAPAARTLFGKRTNLRVLELDPPNAVPAIDVRSVAGGLLVQEPDTVDAGEAHLTVVTPRAPTPEELSDLRLAWKVAKWVKSNAIVLAKVGATVGIGGGQPNRVGAVEIAVRTAGERARGAAMASDAFFPFRDAIDAAARAGIAAVIHPGGSVRDAEVISAAIEHGMAMVLTGIRHFRH